MRTRIKYNILINSIIVTDWFTISANYIIRGKIDTSSLVYKIEEFDGTQVSVGKANNLRICKERIKSLLVESGVNFNNEIRT